MPIKARSAKAKGSGFERDIVSYISDIPDWSARRQPLSGALQDWPHDVVADHPEVGRITIECKHHASPMKQVRKWIGSADWLITKANHERDPLVHMPLSQLLRLLDRT